MNSNDPIVENLGVVDPGIFPKSHGDQRLRCYLACALTQASEDYRKKMTDDFRPELGELFRILEFTGLVGGTEVVAHTHDFNCVRNADLLVADCTYPSTGLGIELGLAISVNKPIFLMAWDGGPKVTRMVTGIYNLNVCPLSEEANAPFGVMHYYKDNPTELLPKIQEFGKKIAYYL